jgi:hypothetical protein
MKERRWTIAELVLGDPRLIKPRFRHARLLTKLYILVA